MTKTILKDLCEQRLTLGQIGDELNCSTSTVRRLLRKHGLKTVGRSGVYMCSRCGETDSGEFYPSQRGRCKTCHNQDVGARFRSRRRWALSLFGNKCSRCGYDRCVDALHFHHLDSAKKDPNFRSMRSWSKERIKKEVENCIVLCANCHAEEHSVSTSLVYKERERSVAQSCPCGGAVAYGSKLCEKCSRRSREKIGWPDTETLRQMVAATSYSAVGKKLGVSDNAVRKRIKNHT